MYKIYQSGAEFYEDFNDTYEIVVRPTVKILWRKTGPKYRKMRFDQNESNYIWKDAEKNAR